RSFPRVVSCDDVTARSNSPTEIDRLASGAEETIDSDVMPSQEGWFLDSAKARRPGDRIHPQPRGVPADASRPVRAGQPGPGAVQEASGATGEGDSHVATRDAVSPAGRGPAHPGPSPPAASAPMRAPGGSLPPVHLPDRDGA